MRPHPFPRFSINRLLALLLNILLCSGCHIGYLSKATITEANILLSSKNIDEILVHPQGYTTDELEKLRLVKEARLFSINELRLTPHQSFTRYTDVGNEALAWVLVAAKQDSFELKTWWFPIVGRVPYLGFFEKKDAEKEAERLRTHGYETSIRPTDAFSTLGWFNDPVLSTTLQRDPLSIVSTVIHESLHSTVWLPGSVPFNETLAQFVGLEGARQFYFQRYAPYKKNYSKQISTINSWVDGQKRIAQIVESLTKELSTLYSCTCLSKEDLLTQKSHLFENAKRKVRCIFPSSTILSSPNNAELIQLSLYMTHTNSFNLLFENLNKNIPQFIDAMIAIKEEASQQQKDPYDILQQYAKRSPHPLRHGKM